MNTAEHQVVNAWHDALNRGDVDALAALVTEDVEIGGPRGATRGVATMRDWVGRAGIRLDPLRSFQRGPTLVVEQQASWRSPETAEVQSTDTVASVFVVHDGRIGLVVRYPSVTEAFAAAGLTEADSVPEA